MTQNFRHKNLTNSTACNLKTNNFLTTRSHKTTNSESRGAYEDSMFLVIVTLVFEIRFFVRVRSVITSAIILNVERSSDCYPKWSNSNPFISNPLAVIHCDDDFDSKVFADVCN